MNVTVNAKVLYFKTARLTIRPWRLYDIDNFYNYASNPKVAKMAGFEVHPSKDRTRSILTQYIQFNCAVAITIDDKVIGSITFDRYPENEMPEFKRLWGLEIGYVLNEDYWGQGLMKEALDALIPYLFNEENIDFITCGHFITNKQSKRVQEKCGFKHYKLIKHVSVSGEESDAWLSVLKREEYEKNSKE